MPRKSNNYHFIYKTTNLINKKYYIGMHSTKNLDDGYLGSGDKIRRSIKKHGRENFKIEIIEFLPDRNSLIKREKEIINEDLLKDSSCMNLKLGGYGGFSSEQQKNNAKKSNTKQKWLRENDEDWVNKKSQLISSALLYSYETGKREKKQPIDWTGRKHNEYSKSLIGEKSSINQKGEKNSQFGTFWITNGIENKKVKYKMEIPFGYWRGRI